jgi:S1-C subfamily serine protease
MVLTRRTARRTLAVAAGLLALAGASRPAPAQEPARPARAPRPATGTTRPTWSAAESQEPGGAWIGIGLSCWSCSRSSEGKSLPRWTFTAPPVVYSVDRGGPADAAGLRTGDSLVEIDGHAFVSREGGQAFANLRSGVRVRLTYSRDGRRRTVALVPVDRPASAAEADVARGAEEVARSYEEVARSYEALRESSRTRAEESERARRDLTRLQGVFRNSRGKVLSDTSLQRIQEYLAQAERALRRAPGNVLVPPAPRQPFAFSPGVAPVPPVRPQPPMVVSPGVAPVPPVVSLGGLRYSGRVGNTVVEARRPGGVNVVETGDSEVVLTGGDLTVRIAVEPGRVTFSRGSGTGLVGSGVVRTSGSDVAYGVTGYLVGTRLGAALGATSGVLVLEVETGSHADSLGVVPGDVLVELNDRPVASITQSRLFGGRFLRPATLQPGAQTAVVVRSRERRTLVLGAPPAAPRARPAVPPARPPRRP